MLRDKDPDALTADEFNVLNLLEIIAKNLSFCDAVKLLNATQREVSLMQGLPVEVESCRHDFISIWEVVSKQMRLFKEKFHQLSWDGDGESFVLDHNRVMGAAQDEID
ncbi:hypothetical protein FOZ61_000869, partial [Perkinsus olseni]